MRSDDEKRLYNVIKGMCSEIKERVWKVAMEIEFEFPQELAWMNADDRRNVVEAVMYDYDTPDLLWFIEELKEKKEQREAE